MAAPPASITPCPSDLRDRERAILAPCSRRRSWAGAASPPECVMRPFRGVSRFIFSACFHKRPSEQRSMKQDVEV